ncbi:hypothetical protein DOY81_012518, partial [Sarcophaga bullata]
ALELKSKLVEYEKYSNEEFKFGNNKILKDNRLANLFWQFQKIFKMDCATSLVKYILFVFNALMSTCCLQTLSPKTLFT